MNKSLFLLILTFSLITTTFFACQQKIIIGANENSNVEKTVMLKKEATTDFFLSEPQKIETAIPTPFLMLSCYLESDDFTGKLFYRTKLKMQWSDWKVFPPMDEEGVIGRTAFGGVEVDANTKAVQIKSTYQPNETPFVIRLFAPGHSKKNTSAQQRGAPDACSCDQPNFEGRGDWCPSGNCPQDATPQNTVPTHIIVHHSAGFTTSSDFAAVVRSYWDLHVNTNGWDDIGYNWLVDGNGVIYEGRGENRQGAHFSCMNQKTTGICVIGNYETATPAAAAVETLKNFIAWEACSKNIDVAGMEFHPNSNSNLGNVSGHRDGNGLPNSCSSTVCPGENLYTLLPSIKSAVVAFPCLQDNPTNVNVLLENERLDVFPNPSAGDFQIEWENLVVKNVVIYDAIGQEVKRLMNISNKTLTSQTEAVHLKTSGVYQVQIWLEDGRYFSQKVVVQN